MQPNIRRLTAPTLQTEAPTPTTDGLLDAILDATPSASPAPLPEADYEVLDEPLSATRRWDEEARQLDGQLQRAPEEGELLVVTRVEVEAVLSRAGKPSVKITYWHGSIRIATETLPMPRNPFTMSLWEERARTTAALMGEPREAALNAVANASRDSGQSLIKRYIAPPGFLYKRTMVDGWPRMQPVMPAARPAPSRARQRRSTCVVCSDPSCSIGPFSTE